MDFSCASLHNDVNIKIGIIYKKCEYTQNPLHSEENCAIVFVQYEYFMNEDFLCKAPVSCSGLCIGWLYGGNVFAQVFCLRAVFLLDYFLRFVGNDRRDLLF